MVIGEDDLAGVDGEALRERAADPQFVGEPGLRGPAEGFEAARKGVDLGDHQPLELAQRLFVEGDVLEVADAYALVFEAPSGGAKGQRGVVLDPREPLFRRRGYQFAVAHQGGGGIVKLRGNPENVPAHP